MPFDGTTYVRELDGVRVGNQLARVFNLMRDGAWRSLREIADGTEGLPEASISARLRDIRKEKFARWFTMESRRRTTGTWEYRVRPVHTQAELPYVGSRGNPYPLRFPAAGGRAKGLMGRTLVTVFQKVTRNG